MAKLQLGKKGQDITAETIIGKRPQRQKTPQLSDSNQRRQDMEAAKQLGVKVPDEHS